mmetsp:Transcript_50052/g.139045  ORF Transcript_50052/g.139045 Transcript_50052/m.139045 type:complete len:222 (+) Transcript_50052:64-729(+)
MHASSSLSHSQQMLPPPLRGKVSPSLATAPPGLLQHHRPPCHHCCNQGHRGACILAVFKSVARGAYQCCCCPTRPAGMRTCTLPKAPGSLGAGWYRAPGGTTPVTTTPVLTKPGATTMPGRSGAGMLGAGVTGLRAASAGRVGKRKRAVASPASRRRCRSRRLSSASFTKISLDSRSSARRDSTTRLRTLMRTVSLIISITSITFSTPKFFGDKTFLKYLL